MAETRRALRVLRLASELFPGAPGSRYLLVQVSGPKFFPFATDGAGGWMVARYGDRGEFPQTMHRATVQPYLYMKQSLSRRPSLAIQGIAVAEPGRPWMALYEAAPAAIEANSRQRALDKLKWPMRDYMARRLYRPDGKRARRMQREFLADQSAVRAAKR